MITAFGRKMLVGRISRKTVLEGPMEGTFDSSGFRVWGLGLQLCLEGSGFRVGTYSPIFVFVLH